VLTLREPGTLPLSPLRGSGAYAEVDAGGGGGAEGGAGAV